MKHPPIITRAIEAVCREYGVTAPQLRQGRCIAQQVAAYILRRLAVRGWSSYQRIGYAVGGASHTTVRAWCIRLGVERLCNPKFRALITRLEEIIHA